MGSPPLGLKSMLFLNFGGGESKEALDVQSPNPPFHESLKQFIKNSKVFLKMSGSQETMQAVQAYQGSDLLLDWLGIFIRAPAIQATLCLAPEVRGRTC